MLKNITPMHSEGKTAILAGATGLIGAQLLQQLLEHPAYAQVIALVRRPLGLTHPKYREILFDFDQMSPSDLSGDDLFCALGTTLRVAGSKEAQYKIDCTYPLQLGKLARKNGFKGYFLVSSLGADARSGNFYLRTKGDLEIGLRALHFPVLGIVRPSLLLGKRKEYRLGERLFMVLERLFRPLIPKKYRGIQDEKVARALLHCANGESEGEIILESDRLHTF
jgi:uncharacterized protein YbjT (DUF2867 family)